MAGIPIQTIQGSGGGITVMDGFSMDRTLLTSKDMKMILAGLRSLDSVSGSNYYGQLMEKIKPGSSDIISANDSILIDLSSWDKAAISPKISLVQDAVESRSFMTFFYHSPKRDSNRRIEPYYLIFKWSDWYVYGFCTERNDFRLFKLNRMEQIEIENLHFESRKVLPPDLSENTVFPANINFTVIVQASEKWRFIEEYGPECLTEMDDGRFLYQGYYSKKESLVSFLLTFGNKIEVVEPEELREQLLKTAQEIISMYEKL